MDKKKHGGAKIKHGHTIGKTSPTYNTWVSMRQRCREKHGKYWLRFGKRGITVCERWMKFENFLEDMGIRPDGKELCRIDNNGNYESSNCLWASRFDCRRTFGKKILMPDGEKYTIREISDGSGVPITTIQARVQRNVPSELIASPPYGFRPTVESIPPFTGTSVKEHMAYLRKNGCSFRQIGNHFNLSRQRIHQILKNV